MTAAAPSIRRYITKSRRGHWTLTLVNQKTGQRAYSEKHDNRHAALAEEDALMERLTATPADRDGVAASVARFAAVNSAPAAKAPVAMAAAEFELPWKQVEAIVMAMNARTGEDCGVSINGMGTDTRCKVSGRRQQVMFVIGEVAAHGEDALVGCEFWAQATATPAAAGYQSAEAAERRMGC